MGQRVQGDAPCRDNTQWVISLSLLTTSSPLFFREMLIKTTMRHYIIGVTRIKACTITNIGNDMEIGKLIRQFIQRLQPLLANSLAVLQKWRRHIDRQMAQPVKVQGVQT